MTVTMYSKPHCPNCEIARATALLHGVQLDIVTLTADTITAFKEKFPSVKAVPFLVQGERVIGGLKEFKEWCRAGA